MDIEPKERLRLLFQKGEEVDINYSIPARRYFRSCQEIIRMANVYTDEKNYENAYVLYAKFIVLSFEKLKNHPEYNKVPVSERNANKKALKLAFKSAELLKQILEKKYNESYQKYLKEQELLRLQAEAVEAERLKLAKEEEERIENERKEKEKQQLNAFLREQEYKELEKERLAIEAEFADKISINDNQNKKSQPSSAPLLPVAFAPPPSTITPPAVTSSILPPKPLPRQISYPSLPTNNNPPPAATQTPSLPTFDRSLKPQSSSTSTVNTPNVVGASSIASSLIKSSNKYGLRTVVCPSDLPLKFMEVVKDNTQRNMETCGILFGKLANEAFIITHVLLPHQTGAPDSCDTTREEDMWEFQDLYDGICLGWIHTHPSQTAFLSSVDLHTHYPYQCLMPESVAIVCSGKYNEVGYFMLTPNHGMTVIGKCTKPGFHPHQKNPPLFESCDHISTSTQHSSQIVDWRKK